MLHMIEHVFIEQSLVAAFAVVGAVMWVSLVLSRRLTAGRVHGSAIAIVIGLGLAYVGGLVTGGQKGRADIPVFAGIGLMGGAMLRAFAIVATAFEVDVIEARRAGMLGVVALALGHDPAVHRSGPPSPWPMATPMRSASPPSVPARSPTSLVPSPELRSERTPRSSRCPSPRVCSRRCSSWLARRSSPASSVSTTPVPPWPSAV